MKRTLLLILTATALSALPVHYSPNGLPFYAYEDFAAYQAAEMYRTRYVPFLDRLPDKNPIMSWSHLAPVVHYVAPQADPVPTPEPGTVGMVVAGLALVGIRWRAR